MTDTKSKKTSGRKRNDPRVWVEVLQNGVLVASTVKPLGKNGKVLLTSKMSGDLAIPFYALPRDIELLRIQGNRVFVNIDQAWDGFATSRGAPVLVKRTNRNSQVIEMGLRDIASLALNDLRLLVRIGPELRRYERRVKPTRAYRGSLAALLWPSKQDRFSLLGGVGLAAALLLVGTGTLGALKFQRSDLIEDLDGKYTVGFLHPDCFRTAPEALQVRLDRRNYYRSTISYYRAFAAMTMNWSLPARYDAYMFPTSRRLFAAAYDRYREALARRTAEQRGVEQVARARPGAALLSIPTVQGETMEGATLRVVSKVTVMQAAFAETLERKRSLNKLLKTDPEYDYTAYRKVKVNERAREALARIQPFKGVTDEELMYLESESLARRAQREQDRIEGSRGSRKLLAPAEHLPLGIRSGIEFATFLEPPSNEDLDIKFEQLQASEYGRSLAAAEEVIEEPLIGEIEPELIEAQIKKNRFEVQLCYEHALRRNQSTEGKTQWKWRVDTRGKISDVDLVSSDIRDQEMARCIRQKIARWSFPRPRRGAIEVRYTFDFEKARG